MDNKFLENKYIFVDFDGTLCEYRYFGHVSSKTVDPDGVFLGSKSLYELLFKQLDDLRPLKTMQNLLKNLDSNKIYILGAINTYYEIKSKIKWLHEHYPFLKEENFIFVADKNIKTEVLKEYKKALNLKYDEMIFIDDKIDSLCSAEEQGFPSYHITSFVE